METRRGEHSGFPVLYITGELDLSVHPELESILEEVAGAGDCVILDLLDVSYTDSSPIGLLVSVHRDLASRGGALAIVCCQEDVRRILHVVGLMDRFDIFDDINEAAEYLKPLCAN